MSSDAEALSLEKSVYDPLPQRPGLGPGPPRVELLCRLPALAAGDEVDLGHLERSGAFPCNSDDVEKNADGRGEVGEEEGFGSIVGAPDGPDGDVELRDEHDDQDDGTDDRAKDTKHGSERKLVDVVTLCFPGLCECWRQTNGSDGNQILLPDRRAMSQKIPTSLPGGIGCERC